MTTETADRTESARKQARAQLDSIREIVERMQHIDGGCDGDEDCTLTDEEVYGGLGLLHQGRVATEEDRKQYHDEDEARQQIEEDPLSVEVRSDWHTPGDDDKEDSEYCILLCTGGPAVRIVGDMGTFHQPETARLECQDWFTPWIRVDTTSSDEDILLAYARCLYFGD